VVRITRKRYRIASGILCVVMLFLIADAYVSYSINAFYFPKTDHLASYIWMGTTLILAATAAFEAAFARLWRRLFFRRRDWRDTNQIAGP
jgi:hypothetical protein